MTTPKILGWAAAAAVAASAVLAGGHGSPQDQAIKARKAQMTLYSFNMSILGAMAKGEVEYDADAASMAANDLKNATHMTLASAWMPGTDNASMKNTRALPEIWSTFPAIMENGQQMREASANLAAVAGDGLDALRGAIGPAGKACGACHKKYRAEN